MLAAPHKIELFISKLGECIWHHGVLCFSVLPFSYFHLSVGEKNKVLLDHT